MEKKHIKQIVNDAFNNETPDLLSNIKKEMKHIKQIEPLLYKTNKTKVSNFSLTLKRLAYCALACVLFIGGIFIGKIKPTTQVATKEASIYLDVNPSIEIQIDENNNVVECIAGNDDGTKILKNISLENVEVETALYAIVGSMYTNGYLNSETNSILVSVDSYTDNETILLDDISNQIDNVFKENEDMKCSIIAQKVDSNDSLKELAKEYNISIGKMHLIEKIISNSNLYTEGNIDELVSMSIHELDLIYQSLKIDKNKDEVISGKPSGYLKHEEALEFVLDYLDKSIQDVEWYDVVALYHYDENKERKMIFLVSIILNGENEKFKYIVDCITGEIMPEETVDEWKDKMPNDGHFGGLKGDKHTQGNDGKFGNQPSFH